MLIAGNVTFTLVLPLPVSVPLTEELDEDEVL
jgi:hypothetical protein